MLPSSEKRAKRIHNGERCQPHQSHVSQNEDKRQRSLRVQNMAPLHHSFYGGSLFWGSFSTAFPHLCVHPSTSQNSFQIQAKRNKEEEKKKLGLLGRWLWWHSGEPNTNQSTQIQEERQIKRVGREMHPFFCIPSPEEHSCILLLCYWHSTHCFRSPWPDCIRAKKKWPLEENDCNFPGTTFVGRCKMVGNEVSRIDSWIIMVS